MIVFLFAAGYALFGAITAAVIARLLDFDPGDDADVMATLGIGMVWPIACVFGFLMFATSRLIRAAQRGNP